MPFYGPVEDEAVYFLTRLERAADPDAADDAQPRQLRRLALAARPLARRAGRGGRRDDPARDARRRSCSSPTAASAACAPATGAAAATASSCRTSSPAPTSSRRVTVLAEGTQGHLTGAAIDRFGLEGENPQVWALGVKEVWKVAKPLDRVDPHDGLAAPRHAPSTASSAARSSTRWATTWSRSAWSSGLDYRDVELSVARPAAGAEDAPADPQDPRRRRADRPGARRRSRRAASLALPRRLHAPGLLLCGDGAGLVNVPALKGIHYAIESGRLAAEAAFARSGRGERRRPPRRAQRLRRGAARELRLERPARGAQHAPGLRPRASGSAARSRAR